MRCKASRIFAAVAVILLGLTYDGRAQNPPVAVQLPTGDYLIAVQPADSFPAGMVGEWHLVLEPGGRYRVVRNGNAVVLGEYRAAGDTLQFVDRSGEMSCGADPATYLWKSGTDGALVLVTVRDECFGRAKLTTLRAMSRAKN